MRKIIFILMIAFSCADAYSKNNLKIKIGTSEKTFKTRFANQSYEITLIRVKSDAKLVNMLTTGQIDMAILPAKNAVKATWYRQRLGINLKSGKSFEYLVSLKNKDQIDIKNIANKRIALIMNSGSEFILNEFAGHSNYKKQYVNSLEMEKILQDKEKNVDGMLMDATAFGLLQEKRRYRVKEIYAGPRVLVASEQERRVIAADKFVELISLSHNKFSVMDNKDYTFIESLNDSLTKSPISQEYFKLSNLYREKN